MASVSARETVSAVGPAKILGIGLVILAVGVVGARSFGLLDGVTSDSPVARDAQGEMVSADTTSATDSPGQGEGAKSPNLGLSVVVHVTGAVLRPGVYSLPDGSRAVDAVQAAGGSTRNADRSAINLASILSDGVQLYVPTVSEVAKGWAASTPSLSGSSGTGQTSGSASGGPVNINTATVAELDTLPGIGQVTAGRIVADRAANGPFSSVAELARISGIGDAKVSALDGLAVAR